MNLRNNPNKYHGLRPRFLLLPTLMVLLVSLNCTMSENFADVFIAAWNYLTRSSNDNISTTDLVEMTATGQFLLVPDNNIEYAQNEITLHWKVDWRNGEVQPDVWGEGVWNPVSGDAWTDMELTFEGTVTPDGQTFSGTIHSIGSQDWGVGVETLDYYSNWTATRREGFIEGTVDGLGGPFRLDVQSVKEP